jgi:hypothetical protein
LLEDADKNRVKALVVFGSIFGFFGLGMVIGAALSFSNTQDFLLVARTAPGKIVALEPVRSKNGYVYHPVAEFQVDGFIHHHRSASGSNPAAFNVGDQVEIYYDPKNPERARIHSFMELWGLAAILGGMGSLFSALALGVFGRLIFLARMKKWLLQNGRPIEAKVSQVRLNTSIRVNGRNPWVIDCQWEDELGRVHVFTSEWLWFNPSEWVPQGSTIQVLIDPAKPKRHFVVLPQTLPKAA